MKKENDAERLNTFVSANGETRAHAYVGFGRVGKIYCLSWDERSSLSRDDKEEVSLSLVRQLQELHGRKVVLPRLLIVLRGTD